MRRVTWRAVCVSLSFQGTNGQAVMGAEPDRSAGPRAVVGRAGHAAHRTRGLGRIKAWCLRFMHAEASLSLFILSCQTLVH